MKPKTQSLTQELLNYSKETGLLSEVFFFVLYYLTQIKINWQVKAFENWPILFGKN